MIRVTIELVPYGIEANKRTIASARIANDASGTPSVGNYTYQLFDKAGKLYREGKLMGFPRKRLLAWYLLRRILIKALEDD